MMYSGQDVVVGNVYIKDDVDYDHHIGNHVAIDNGFHCTVNLNIGDYVHIGPNVSVIGGKKCTLILDDFSGIAAGSVIVCGSDNYTTGKLLNPMIPEEFRDTIYGNVHFKAFSCCGVNSTIFPNVVVAEGSVLGAASLLTSNTEDWGIYFGVPAKLKGSRNRDLAKELANKIKR